MKFPVCTSLVCVLLLSFNVESSPPQGLGEGHRHPPGQRSHRRHDGLGGHDDNKVGDGGYSMYIFGDSFVDNGNLPRENQGRPYLARQWYDPYSATGRFSNHLVQSDFIANILGQAEVPPAHRLTRHARPEGMNFAVGGSGVFELPGTTTLRDQVLTFHRLVKARKIKKRHLTGRSVALIAVSGNDYLHLGVETNGSADVTALAEKVTWEIQANVQSLRDIGVRKVLVNNLFPLGCSPSETKPNYTECDEQGNRAASLHNRYLNAKLAGMDGVLVLNLSDTFGKILEHHGDGGDDVSNKFSHKLRPCCEAEEASSYCGLLMWDADLEPPQGIQMYKVCPEPDRFFFWDDTNPTQAGWAAVMGELENPIRKFLGLDS